MKIFHSILITVLTLSFGVLGMLTLSPQAAEPPLTASKTVEAPQVPNSISAPTAGIQLAQPLSPEEQWIHDVITDAGLTISSNVTFVVTDGSANCGSIKSYNGTGGGCTHLFYDGHRVVDVSPSVIGTDWGVHVVLHEMGHVYGEDECGAEYFAHAHGSNPNLWGYPQCKK